MEAVRKPRRVSLSTRPKPKPVGLFFTATSAWRQTKHSQLLGQGAVRCHSAPAAAGPGPAPEPPRSTFLLPLTPHHRCSNSFPVNAGKIHPLPLWGLGGWDTECEGRSSTPAPAAREPDFLSEIKIWTRAEWCDPGPGTRPGIFCQTDVSLPAAPWSSASSGPLPGGRLTLSSLK